MTVHYGDEKEDEQESRSLTDILSRASDTFHPVLMVPYLLTPSSSPPVFEALRVGDTVFGTSSGYAQLLESYQHNTHRNPTIHKDKRFRMAADGMLQRRDVQLDGRHGEEAVVEYPTVGGNERDPSFC